MPPSDSKSPPDVEFPLVVGQFGLFGDPPGHRGQASTGQTDPTGQIARQHRRAATAPDQPSPMMRRHKRDAVRWRDVRLDPHRVHFGGERSNQTSSRGVLGRHHRAADQIVVRKPAQHLIDCRVKLGFARLTERWFGLRALVWTTSGLVGPHPTVDRQTASPTHPRRIDQTTPQTGLATMAPGLAIGVGGGRPKADRTCRRQQPGANRVGKPVDHTRW